MRIAVERIAIVHHALSRLEGVDVAEQSIYLICPSTIASQSPMVASRPSA
jgi:hypothetical protein